MNLVGKIFVVLILLMSIVFATFSIMVYAAHRNWRDEVLKQGVGWKDRYRQKSDEAAQAKADRDNMALQLNGQTYAMNQTLAKLQSSLRNMGKDLAQKTDESNLKATVLAANTDALHAAEKNVEDLTREVKNLAPKLPAPSGKPMSKSNSPIRSTTNSSSPTASSRCTKNGPTNW